MVWHTAVSLHSRTEKGAAALAHEDIARCKELPPRALGDELSAGAGARLDVLIGGSLLRPTGSALPPFVTLPWIVSHPAAPSGRALGQNAGWLGPRHDPLVLSGDPAAPGFNVAGTLGRATAVKADRLHGRRDLLEQIDTVAGPAHVWQERALDLLSSPVAQQAFALTAHRYQSVRPSGRPLLQLSGLTRRSW